MRVTSASEMQRVEALAFSEQGEQLAEQYMEEAGLQIALKVQSFLRARGLAKTLRNAWVYLLCGRGNNAGDAYVCGRHLLACGMKVLAYQIPPLDGASPLCSQKAAAFVQKGGERQFVSATVDPAGLFQNQNLCASSALIIDGLLGTGLRAELKAPYRLLIEAANTSGLPILAIDIPSGLSGDYGLGAFGTEAEAKIGSGAVIQATQTLFLGLPKIGFFLGEAWERVGELVAVDFGLPVAYCEKTEALAEWLSIRDVAPLLPPLKRCRHKYQAGSVAAWAGSMGMTGAALLACHASLRSGSGLVRLLHTDEWQPSQANPPWELMTQSFIASDLWTEGSQAAQSFAAQLSAASACLIGPGLGLRSEVAKLLGEVVPKLQKPLVLDADALSIFASKPFDLPPKVIFTPHTGEMQRLLGQKTPWQNTPESLVRCQSFAERHKITLVLKGAPTFIFHPGQTPALIGRGDPGMATAGSGDVLTGILASLLSQGLEPFAAAKFGVFLHALSGEAAAVTLGSRSLMASDLIAHLPEAFAQLV